MTRIINLTVKLKMEVEFVTEPDAFFSKLNLMLRTGLGERLASNADVVEVIALLDPEGTLTHKPQIESLLEDFDLAASLWGIDDVLEICPNLSKDDALMVLRSVTDRSDSYCGIQSHTIADAIEGVLGIDSDTGIRFDSPDSIQWIAVRDKEREILSQPSHLDSILTNFGIASVIWCVEDVLEVRPDLTLEQAATVLDAVRAKHEANCGIGWDTLEHFAESLFGQAPNAPD